ncbi:hypothetical protein QW71_14090 [Paenibacillus sp. IHB B 3415]|uniref:DUF4386 domain-containing protein n=1 Tax=Paenibacillus sp. IHB B 3415 TaxID=867080 RepID=UPI0005730EE2|nr:DUF4386 domain-containing protein [Paenibacillus sp. IHB B 3415]KHL95131.1 hypothetical protein QW71_14090 [Paenibacillus sp. IHB B 3415]
MNRNARVAGALFMVSTGAYMIGSGFLNPIIMQPELLTGLYLDRTKLFAGLFLELINAIAVVGIAMLLYPVLKKYNEAFALGYFGFRIIESVILIISLTGPISFITLSKDFISEEASGRSYLQSIANLAVEAHFILFELAMIALSLGSLLLCYVLYRSKLIPRVLSVIGFIGYTGLLTSSCLAITGRDTGAVLYIPGAIFEIVLPLWLMVKGLNLRAEKS